MFTRSILVPSLVVCAIAAPVLFSQAKKGAAPVETGTGFANLAGYSDSGNTSLPTAQYDGRLNSPFQGPGPTNYQTAPSRDQVFPLTNSVGNPALRTGTTNLSNMANAGSPTSSPVGYGVPIATKSNLAPMTTFPANSPTNGMPTNGNQPNGMIVDYGSVQTVIYPGGVNGPDLTAQPMEFMPVTNFEEIFRFDVTSQWIMNRWNRVSTVAGNSGLHGLRVALITGTNSWDLHGSLTYYFDNDQRMQRITFRGWAGNAKMLTELITRRFEFKSQPTQWAGFYLAKTRRHETGGALMRYPTVIYRDNPIQQIAVVMEINDPKGGFALSNEFQSLIAGSKRTH